MLEFRLSALMDSDLAWVNGKSGRQSWRYADAFQRSIVSDCHLRPTLQKFSLRAGTMAKALRRPGAEPLVSGPGSVGAKP